MRCAWWLYCNRHIWNIYIYKHQSLCMRYLLPGHLATSRYLHRLPSLCTLYLSSSTNIVAGLWHLVEKWACNRAQTCLELCYLHLISISLSDRIRHTVTLLRSNRIPSHPDFRIQTTWNVRWHNWSHVFDLDPNVNGGYLKYYLKKISFIEAW